MNVNGVTKSEGFSLGKFFSDSTVQLILIVGATAAISYGAYQIRKQYLEKEKYDKNLN